jgi:hypothetical protein
MAPPCVPTFVPFCGSQAFPLARKESLKCQRRNLRRARCGTPSSLIKLTGKGWGHRFAAAQSTLPRIVTEWTMTLGDSANLRKPAADARIGGRPMFRVTTLPVPGSSGDKRSKHQNTGSSLRPSATHTDFAERASMDEITTVGLEAQDRCRTNAAESVRLPEY